MVNRPPLFEALRLASLRFGGGCSASFVSPKGLIMTNHHCVRSNLALAQGEEDWIVNGFYATSLEKEVRLHSGRRPDDSLIPLTVRQLISSVNVTDLVNQGIDAGDDDATVEKKRNTNMVKIRSNASNDHPDLTPEIIKLHQGAVYQLYSYKIYNDIRFVEYCGHPHARFHGLRPVLSDGDWGLLGVHRDGPRRTDYDFLGARAPLLPGCRRVQRRNGR